MKRVFLVIGGVLFVILLIIAITVSPKDKMNEELLNIEYDIKGNISELNYKSENPIVAMYIENYGSIVMELYPDVAPNTVNNFISLIKQGFYDDNTMHRLVPGFVLQGGDPTGSGSGGPGYEIKGEFSSNGFDNNLSHKKWIVSMARSGEPDSAGSQFFICLDDANYLDGNYAAFGKVIDGFDILKRIESNEIVVDTDSGKLKNNLKIKKVLLDLNNKEYPEVEKIN